MAPDADDLSLVASAARARIDSYRIERERDAAVRRVRAGQNITAAWKPLSSDFLSAKAKLQPRDSKGRWIDMGAMVRWLDGSQIGGDRKKLSGAQGGKSYRQGKVDGFDANTKKYSIKPDGGGPDIQLEGKDLEVIKAVIPDAPTAPGAPAPAASRSEWESGSDDLKKQMKDLGMEDGYLEEELDNLAANPASSDQEQKDRLNEALKKDIADNENRVTGEEQADTRDMIDNLPRVGVSDDEDSWSDAEKGAMNGDSPAAPIEPPADTPTSGLAAALAKAGLPVEDNPELGDYLDELDNEPDLSLSKMHMDSVQEELDKLKPSMTDAEANDVQSAFDDMKSKMNDGTASDLTVPDDFDAASAGSGDPTARVSKAASDIKPGDVIMSTTGHKAFKVAYTDDGVIGGKDLTGKAASVHYPEGSNASFDVAENPDLIQNENDDKWPTQATLSRALFDKFGDPAQGDYDAQKSKFDADAAKLRSYEYEPTAASVGSDLKKMYGDRSDRRQQNTDSFTSKGAAILKATPQAPSSSAASEAPSDAPSDAPSPSTDGPDVGVSDWRNPAESVQKKPSELKTGDVIVDQLGNGPVRLKYTGDATDEDYPFVNGIDLETGQLKNVSTDGRMVDVLTNPDLVKTHNDVHFPNNEIMARNLFTQFGDGGKYDKNKWMADAADLKSDMEKERFYIGGVSSRLRKKYGAGDASDGSLYTEDKWNSKARRVLGDSPVYGPMNRLSNQIEKALPAGEEKPMVSSWSRTLGQSLVDKAPSGNITEIAKLMYQNRHPNDSWDSADQQVWMDAAQKVMEK